MTRPLIISCDWIPPAFGAVGQYEMLRARNAAAQGRAVTLIGLGQGGTRSTEAVGNGSLSIIRIKAELPQKSIIIRRSLWTIGIILILLWTTWSVARKQPEAEVKVTGSPPFFAYGFILLNAVTLRRRIIYRMTDFYPETAIAAGRLSWAKLLAPFFRWTRRLTDRVEVLSEDQKKRLVDSGITGDRVTLERDWSPVSFEGVERRPDRPFGETDCVLLYSGNLGIAHDFETFAEAYRRHIHEGSNRVRLWLNAQGVGVVRLAEYCADHNLPVFQSPPVRLDDLGATLLAADAHLVLLGDAFWGYVFPSKIYAARESRKPIFYVGPEQSDVSAIALSSVNSFSIRNGDPDAAFAALEALADKNQRTLT